MATETSNPQHVSAAQLTASLGKINELEQTLWAAEPTDILLDEYQSAFRQLEQLLTATGFNQRHEFIVVIPVADRPLHLKNCLDSLLQQCKTFGYGGFADNRFLKVSAIIADDSREPDNIASHKAIADECNRQGLSTLYFGLDEQLDQMDLLNDATREKLVRVLGSASAEAFYHKGPSVMRNIAYLELNKIRSDNDKILFYFIDSDQEFQLKISTAAGDKNLHACNYFYYLDQIFSRTNTRVLTGKVVGDPPVSPSVMAGNFLEDVSRFLQQIAAADPALPCQFHGARQQGQVAASYHDMAGLFGFEANSEPCQYHCSIEGEHDNAQCLQHFCSRLSHFFYGEHPTRKTYYQHADVLGSVTPARTVYTGNYIFKPDALKHFIPFASLKLRMAGPVLGRLIQAEMKEAFVSANLPMLHERTLQETGQSEFRPGIYADIVRTDLSGEFERQFHGDVMLFSMEKLVALGYPQQTPGAEVIAATVAATHADLLQQYNDKRLSIAAKLSLLNTYGNDQQHWWNRSHAHAEAVHHFRLFISNIEYNFGDDSAGYAKINSASNRAERHAAIVDAISCLSQDREIWEKTLNAQFA